MGRSIMSEKNLPKFEDTEELPSFDQTEAVAPEKMGAGEAALLGAEQGLTLGNSDEMSGGIGAGLDKTQALLNKMGLAEPSPTEVNAKLAAEGTKGDIGPKSTLDLYKEMRDAERAKIKKGEKDQPLASFGGNLAGGALLAPIAGALTPIKVGAKAGTLAKIGAGAYNGAALGSLAGIGTSEATSPDQLTEDVESNAKFGGLVGGAIPAAGAALDTAGNAVANTKTYQDLLGKLNAGKSGYNLSSPDVQLQGRDKLKELAAKADDAIRAKSSDIFTAKGKLLDQLEQSGAKVDTAPLLKEFADTVGSSPSLDETERHAITNTLNVNFKNGFTKSPKELEKLLTDLKDLKAKVATPTGYEAVTDAIENVKGLQSGLSPELGHLNNQAFQTVDAGAALTGSNPLDYQNSKKNQSMVESMANQFQNQDDTKIRSKLNDILQGRLTTSKNAKISPLSDLVPEAAKAISETQPVANAMSLANEQQSPTFKGGNLFASTANAINSIGGLVANKAGLAQKASTDFLKSGVQKLSDMDQNTLGGLGSAIAKIGGKAGEQFASVLKQASTQNPQSKNAMIFGLMQQPEFRAMYNQINGINTSTMKLPDVENTVDTEGTSNGQ